MFCKNCGNEIANNDKFCKNCGWKNEDVTASEGANNLANNKSNVTMQKIGAQGDVWSKFNLYAIICAAIMVIGVLVPFVSVSLLGTKMSTTLMDGTDGWFYLVVALVAILLSLKNGSVSVIIVGAIAMYLTAIKVSGFDIVFHREIGFYLLVFSSIGITISGIVKLKCKKIIKIILSVVVAIIGVALFYAAGDTEEIQTTTEQQVSEDDVRDLEMQGDVSSAKTIRTAVETALGNEESYIALYETEGGLAGELIDCTEEGMKVLPERFAEAIKSNIGDTLPSVKYTENGADHFSFVCAEQGNVKVYVCNKDNSQKWMLAPELDVEYGGDYITADEEELVEGGTTEEITTEEVIEIYTSGEAIQWDVSSAKTIKTAVETALGNEESYIALYETEGGLAGELIDCTEEGMKVLLESFAREIKFNIGDTLPSVKYTENGADHFSFVCAEQGNVKVYVCNKDNSQKWMLAPELDVEYGGDYITADEDKTTENTSAGSNMYVLQSYQSYVGETMVTINLEYTDDNTGYMAMFVGDDSEPSVYDIYFDGTTWYSYDGTHIISYLSNGNIMISSNTVDLPYAGEYTFVSQQVY